MILKDFTARPTTDPADFFYRRDSIFATDLLIACISEFDLFSWLDKQPSDAKEIEKQFAFSSRTADVALSLFVCMGLLSRENDRYSLTAVAKEYFTADSNWSLVPYYATLKDRVVVQKMIDVLKSDRPASWGGQSQGTNWEDSMNDPDFAASFTAAMDSRGAFLAPRMAEVLDFSSHRGLLDVAGASGVYAGAIVTRHPHLKAAVLEKPPVDQVARLSLESRSLQDKVDVIAGDMFTDAYPKEFDLHLFSHVMHDWNEEQNRKLMEQSFKALPKNGKILIHDAHLNEDKSAPLTVAEYSVFLMYNTPGKCYSFGEMKNMLTETGFTDIGWQPTGLNRTVVFGTKK